MDFHVKRLGPERIDEAVDVLCEAFAAYPTMRYICGEHDGYEQRLRSLVTFHTNVRYVRGDPVLAVTTDEDEVVAVANIVLPGDRESSPEVEADRERLWRELGDDARRRYEVYGAIHPGFGTEKPHYHLTMIGVRRDWAGRGLARRLIDVLHEMSRRDPASCGVSLATEDPVNVPLYEHLGYRVVGEARLSDELRTWTFFRDDEE